MKAVRLNSYGNPLEVIEVVDIEVPSIGENDVLVNLEASPINPSNIYMIQGVYPSKPPVPRIFGSEGIAKVVEKGNAVTHLNIGDRILLPLTSPTWSEQLVISAKNLVPLPEADPLQLAMIAINPPTAYAMMTEFIDLQEGDWIVQNAANSAVGRYVIELSKIMGFKTINIVRRESLVDELKSLGGDVVIVDGPELINQINEQTNNAKIKLAFDAIAGIATNSLAEILTEKGLIIAYGALSMENIQVTMGLLMAKDITLKTFWLVHWFSRTPPAKVLEVYTKLIGFIAQGKLVAKIDKTYDLSDVKQALTHAMKDARDGKILLTGPGYQP